MDEHTLRVLEFDKILRMASAFALTVPGRTRVQRIKPFSDVDEIRQQIVLVSECRGLLSEGQHVGIEHYDDLTPLFRKIRPTDAVLQPFELRSFLALFSSALSLRVLRNNSSCVHLGEIVSALTTHPDIRKAIEEAIDREGKLRDEASPALFSIRQSIRTYERKIKGILEGMQQQKDFIPHLQDFFIAERNNRYVIPVKKDSKGSIPGIVHDISNTGETVYVEPYSIQHLGNDLESSKAEEKLEGYRILKRLSALLRENISEIEADYHIVARIDAIHALAGFSEQMDMSPPEINENEYLRVIQGRHPLLWKALRKAHREGALVPLDFELGKDNSCMVITGSNAGGKTVTLKTIGVLNLMALSGMHTPSGSGTTYPFLRGIFADIGDDQSIEQNLSTFSAHVTRISGIIQESGSHTLVIIDELGTGTDPEQGGALSCAVLRRLNRQGVLTVISTHLGMLKAFAHSEPNCINSAMEMEEVNLNGTSTFLPTYKLATGSPGTSHAFEIAETLGLDGELIKEARQFMTGGGAAIESLIRELQGKSDELNNRLRETREIQQEVASLHSSLKDEHARVRSMKQETLSQAQREAEEIVRKTRREAAQVTESLRRSQLTGARAIMKDIDKKLVKMRKAREERSPEETLKIEEIKEGEPVFLRSLGIHGIVRSADRKSGRVTVLSNGKEITVPLSAVSGTAPDQEPPAPSKKIAPDSGFGVSGMREVPEELNVIGRRVDPALSLIERYLNDASIAGLVCVKIIHGIGTGRLSRAISDYLKDHPLVERSREGEEREGGEAVTMVYL
jgi:DNA mismatch repair protein MutS2